MSEKFLGKTGKGMSWSDLYVADFFPSYDNDLRRVEVRKKKLEAVR